jgi:hypothetical protein
LRYLTSREHTVNELAMEARLALVPDEWDRLPDEWDRHVTARPRTGAARFLEELAAHMSAHPSPGVTAPIVGATKPHHLDDAVAALELVLSQDELDCLAAPYVPHPIPAYYWASPGCYLAGRRDLPSTRRTGSVG